MSQDILSLIKEAKEQFCKLGLSESTIQEYQQRSFNQIIQGYEKEGDYQYKPELMENLISVYESQFSAGVLSRRSRNWRVRGIRILQEIYRTGNYQWKCYQKSNSYRTPPRFEKTVSDFFNTLNGSERYKRETAVIVIRFCSFIDKRSVDRLQDISPEHLRAFLMEMHETHPKSMDQVILPMKKFFYFLEEAGLTEENFSVLLSAAHCRDHTVKPAMSKEDLSALINQIDCTKSPGKRDFAVLSLAITTGLRAGDIVSLKLTDIFWKDQQIRLSQGKTGHRIVLPLQSSVRDALADYILNERPKSDCTMVFLRSEVPFQSFRNGGAVACIFRKYLKKAGIQHQPNDGKTFHGIRRSLGTYMVEEEIPVTTVSQVLGHQLIRSTRQYIALDLQGLQKCTLSMKSLGGEP